MRTRQSYSGNYMADLADEERERDDEQEERDAELRGFYADIEVDRRIEARMERDMEERGEK
jgi:hypothetical protein